MYPKWDYLENFLDSNNYFHRFIAINLLANLSSVDLENKFDKIFDKYFQNLDGKKKIVAGQAALNSGKIAKALPDFRKKITFRLLNIDN